MIDFTKLAKPYIIGEIGINHNGDVNIAKQIASAAYACRFDAVKFQKRTPELCVPEHMWHQKRQTPWGEMDYIEYRRCIEFSDMEYVDIRSHINKTLDWSVSVWDEPSVDFIAQYKPPWVKIPSPKLTDDNLIIKSCSINVPVILSTGMSTLEEVDHAVSLLDKYATQYVILHCNSTYPARFDELNLRVIPMFRERYPNAACIGYSAHDYGIISSVCAIALGAMVIEKHITINREMWGSDQKSSLEVTGMDKLERYVREMYKALGDGVKRIYEGELTKRQSLRGN